MISVRSYAKASIALASAAAFAVILIAADSKSATPLPMKELTQAPGRLQAPQDLKDKDWAQRLQPESFRVLRQAGTERPGGPVYQQFKQQGAGDYYCAGCGNHLFSSAHKFDARCGWPAFWDPAKIDSIELRMDTSHGMIRKEVVCSHCKGHLGHLFEGEGFSTPTDQRYCINGIALVFVPATAAEPTAP